ncbi:hypothetical protein VTH06DRAFT_2822 [Thermothelomyces fergusii]
MASNKPFMTMNDIQKLRKGEPRYKEEECNYYSERTYPAKDVPRDADFINCREVDFFYKDDWIGRSNVWNAHMQLLPGLKVVVRDGYAKVEGERD